MGNRYSRTSQSTQSLKELTINDLPRLCNTLKPVASKCFDLGLQLGVECPRIRNIEHNYRKSKDQLREIISERLKQDSPLTWRDIVTALRALRIREYTLASKIERDHIRNLQPSTSVAPQVSTVSSVPPTSSSLMLGEDLLPVRGSLGEEQSMTPQQGGPQYRESYYSPALMYGQTPVRPPHGENFQPPTPMLGQVKGLLHGENFQPLTPMLGQVRGPPHWKDYQPPTHMMGLAPVRGPPSGENYQPPTHMMGLAVRGAPHRENYQPSTHYLPYSQAWEFPGRVAHGSPQYGTHPLKYTPYIDVVNQHSEILTETISGDLTFFINKFIELGFVPRRATDDVLSQHGVGNGEKAGQLLSLLTAHYNRTHNKKNWFDKFVSVFSSDPAYENLADMMRVALEKMRWSDFGSSVTEPLPHLGKSPLFRSPMDAFVHYIKIGYKQCEIEKNLNVLKWPPTPSKIFIDLACIDWESVVSKEEADEYTRAMVEDGNVDVIMKRKRKIYFEDIARDLPANAPKRIVLVEGAPGVGKSTFAWEFCRRWERGEIAQQYQLVLLFRLRDERMSRAKSLRDLIYHPSEDTCRHFAVELVDCLGSNTLIILEGFDELPGPQRSEPSIFLQLILGQQLPLATILVTSRPWATGDLLVDIKHRIFQHVEILGFTEENITKYVTSVFTGEGKKTVSAIDQSVGGPDEVSEETKKNIDNVMAYIGKYPQIKACMYIPLNAAIVVSIYRESMKSKWVLPTTITELYQALTRILLLCHLRGNSKYSHQKWSVESFEHLPGEVYSQLLEISKTAYEGVCREGGKSVQLIFSDIPDDFETLGLMQSVSQLFMDGQKTSHNFLHLTFQEFLAAFLISTMSSDEQLKHFQRHKDGRLRVVLRFLAGLTKLNNVTADELRSLLGEPRVEQSDEHQTPYCNPMRPDVCVSAHHTNWLFEAQNSELLQSLLHNHTVSFTFTRGMLPLEYYSVGYCIAHSHSKWSLTFDEDPEEEKLHMLVNVAKSVDGNPRIASLKTTSMTSENMNILVNGFSSHVVELYCLKIPDNGNSLSLQPLSTLRILELQVDNSKSAFNISCDLSFSSLEALIISSSCEDTTLGTQTCEAIGKLLLSTSLKKFHLTPNVKNHAFCTHVSNEDMEVITKGLSDNIALPLMSLNIDCKCTFTTTATRSLAQFITRSTTLQYLKIHIDTLKDVNIFVKGLSDNIALPLKSLDIDCKCIFTTTAIEHVLNAITRSNGLERLKIVSATFSISVKGLSDNIALQLKSLDINCKCTFTTTATRSLVQIITRSTTLQYLKLNIDTLEDVDILAKGLSDNIALPLKSLDIDCKCTFTTITTRSLVQIITRSTTLQYLKLNIDTLEDVDILAKGLSDNIALPLKSLDIDCKCTFTTTATRSLVQFITRSTTMKYIRICHVTFSAQGLIELTEAIHHCSRLHEKKLEELPFRLECLEDIVNLRHMIKYHPNMLKSITDWAGVTNVHSQLDEERKASIVRLGLGCSQDTSLSLMRKSICDDVAVALAQALHHNSTLEVLDLSNNNISDAGAIALAQALHHNSTLKVLDLSDNGAIGKECTHQLVQALTVNISITYGNLILPKRCKEYAIQCTQYSTVMDRIYFV